LEVRAADRPSFKPTALEVALYDLNTQIAPAELPQTEPPASTQEQEVPAGQAESVSRSMRDQRQNRSNTYDASTLELLSASAPMNAQVGTGFGPGRIGSGGTLKSTAPR
jgi:hypothetical protein